ncbi:MAG: serine hydrolase [Cyclobacteriaceae bacterium]
MRPFGFLLVLILTNYGCVKKATSPSPVATQSFEWQLAQPEDIGLSSKALDSLGEKLFGKETKKLLIIIDDKIIYERYAEGWHDSVRGHYTASLAKALVGGMSLSAAINDSLIHADAPAFHFIPAWRDSNLKSKITIRHLATHTSGLEDAEVSAEEGALLVKKKLHPHMDLPGWKGQFWRQQPDPFSVARDSAKVLFRPGTQFQYSNPGIAMLTYAVTAALRNSPYDNVRTYLEEKIYEPIGIKNEEYSIGYSKLFSVDSLHLVPSWGGGGFTANAVAKVGRLMLRKGNWQGTQLLDSAVINEAITYAGTALPSSESSGEQKGDGSVRSDANPIPVSTLGWYSNNDGIWKSVPRDAFCGAGAQNQILLVVPSLNLIVVRMGGSLFDEAKGENFWGALEDQLFNPLMDAFISSPYPKSEIISEVEWAPSAEVIRLAEGGDNWPMTWGDDDTLYTAYGDGFGFEPKTKEKLSLGLAKVYGNPPNVKGANIRTPSGERVGEGAFGPKASGMLMVDGILYMWVRNMNNSQLATSVDHGRTWTWANWKFEESFGCPNFINYGKDYSNAQDGYVYTYSPDDETAYKLTDQMVLARVPKEKVMDWRYYEFFSGSDNDGAPVWSEDIRKRKPVFANPGKCYRSAMTYSQELKRYLWCQVLPLSGKDERMGPRFRGGLGIFEAPNPWGPWRTVYYTREWDMGPGESGFLPTKWMDADGSTFYYVFSGEDAFSVRKLIVKKK